MRIFSRIALPVLVGTLLMRGARAHPMAEAPPTEQTDAHSDDLNEIASELSVIKAIFPEVEVLYSYRIDHRVLQAAGDTVGRLVLAANSPASTELLGLDASGEVSWRHDLGVRFSDTSPSIFSLGDNGTVLSRVGLDEDRGAYRVIDSRGTLVATDTTRHEQALAISPCGNYYYRVEQESSRVHLHAIERAGNLDIDLPQLAPPFIDQQTRIEFVAHDRLLASQTQRHYTQYYQRYLVLQLTGGVPVAVESGIAPPWGIQRFYCDDGSFYTRTVDTRELGRVTFSIHCHAPDGNVRWTRHFDDHIDYPRAVVVSSDQLFVAIILYGATYVLDLHTGRVSGVGRHQPGIISVLEAGFYRGHVLATVNAGDGTKTMLLVMRIDDAGGVKDCHIYDFLCCGVQEDRAIVGVFRNAGAHSCLVVALDKGD